MRKRSKGTRNRGVLGVGFRSPQRARLLGVGRSSQAVQRCTSRSLPAPALNAIGFAMARPRPGRHSAKGASAPSPSGSNGMERTRSRPQSPEATAAPRPEQSRRRRRLRLRSSLNGADALSTAITGGDGGSASGAEPVPLSGSVSRAAPVLNSIDLAMARPRPGRHSAKGASAPSSSGSNGMERTRFPVQSRALGRFPARVAEPLRS